MSTILVVDDAAADRRLIGELLAAMPQTEVQFAEHGAAALEMIRRKMPHLVVTDMVMPEMDGLELVTAIRENFPLVPVILTTSRGNEEIAVKALRLGAASYTPKSRLHRDLMQTVEGVLAVAHQKRTNARLMECLTHCQRTFVLGNDAGLIPSLIGCLQDEMTRLGICNHAERIRVGVALDEALLNALYHGNLEVSSELRDSDQDAYSELVRRRREQPPYRDRHIRIESTVSPDEARFRIRDEGPGFDPSDLPDPTDPANLQKVGGRGVLLMRAFMDDVLYNETGNEVTLVKRAAAGSMALETVDS